MAKIKTFAVTVEVITTHVLFIEARKPGGAEERIMTEEGWARAIRYNDQDDGLPRYPGKGVKVIDVREAGQ